MESIEWSREGTQFEFTRLGFGTAPLGNLYRSISDLEAHEILEGAWESGVRYFDTAPLYGLTLSELRLKDFLNDKPRDELVLSTKAGRLMLPCSPKNRIGVGQWFDVPDMTQLYDYSYDGILRSLDESLERMGIDSVEILYVHDLCIFTHGSKKTSDAKIREFMSSGYKAMRRLREEGTVKAIGGGINEWEVCQKLAKLGEFDLFLLAGRYTLLEQEALNSFLPLCEDQGIGIVIGGPYNSGILASGPRKGAYYNYAPASDEVLARVGRIQDVCRHHSVELRAAALQFPLFHPAIVSVIPGGQSIEEVWNNRDILQTEIPVELWADLKSEELLRRDAPTPS